MTENSENTRREIQSMTFEEWKDQASEESLRNASDFVHHYPLEIKRLTLSLEDTTSEQISELVQDLNDDDWTPETICGCEPAFAHEYGSKGHRPDTWSDDLDLDGFLRDLGIME